MILTVAYFFAFFLPRPHRLNCMCPNTRIVKKLARAEAPTTGRRPGGGTVEMTVTPRARRNGSPGIPTRRDVFVPSRR